LIEAGNVDTDSVSRPETPAVSRPDTPSLPRKRPPWEMQEKVNIFTAYIATILVSQH